jgi:hypothetical protein
VTTVYTEVVQRLDRRKVAAADEAQGVAGLRAPSSADHSLIHLCGFLGWVANVEGITEQQAKRPDISVIQIVAGALAALTAAVLASTFGVEGTITGAAFGSVVATVGAAWYGWSLERTHHRLRPKVENIVARPKTDGDQSSTRTVTSIAPPSPGGAEADQEGQAGGAERGTGVGHTFEESGELRRRPRWLVLGLAAFSAFVIAMGAITVYEVMTGKPLSAQVGGTDVGGTTINPRPDMAPTPDPTESPSEQTDSPGPKPENTPDATPTTSSPPRTQTPTQTPTPTPPAGGTPR